MHFYSFGQFFAYYLTQHANATCRRLHFAGTTLVLCVLAAAVATRNPWLLLLMPLIGYGFAWVGHFAFEKNKPATFGHPFYSLASDFVMWWQMLTGQLRLQQPVSGR